ncbi:unnamed protein product [Staurois parvus]|uniref:Uncharacterized protein n=1 Tax=Staurois parvus TaxID=386267 RepID=A0ABN9B9D1_9NEOB|nr:unnamed protein product [Staurois parvus]
MGPPPDPRPLGSARVSKWLVHPWSAHMRYEHTDYTDCSLPESCMAPAIC